MASCCSSKSKDEFLKEKAQNFKTFILKYKPNAEVLEFINKFDPSSIQTTTLTVLLPMKSTGSSESAILELMTKLTIPSEEQAAVKDKIQRYLDLFCEVCLS